MSKETFQIMKRPGFEENQVDLGGVKPVFDGIKNMFTHKPLPFKDRSFYVELEEDNMPMGSKRPFRRFTIRIRKTRDFFMEDLFRFLHAKGKMTWNCKMAITAMGVIISHEIFTNHPTIRKNYYLPIEVCDVIPGQQHIRKLNEIQTADMIKFTCQPPSARANKILASLNILDYQNNEYLKQFGMEISNDMTVVNARILPTPIIQYHQTSKENRIEPKGGEWNLRDKRVATGATLGSWLKPKKILFYRNGVSKSRYIDVLGSELTAIKGACKSLETNYEPTITTGNCLPGTVVETDITHPFEFDFYLLSHAGITGTSRPTHYQVLYDENGFDADGLQTLSYNLCHTYARCTRAVSLVPPVYYAHLAATRAKFYSSYDFDTGETTFEAVKEALRKVMYFI
ncbi:unnamed protein product [Rhizophagus irregularis]|nr:unnamed protein product [Rhizophagus irregularis]